MTKLSHLDEKGAARMVDVSDKAATQRTARAEGFVAMAPATLALVEKGEAKKGDVLAAARIAGIMAAKRTHELIPLCHPLAITKATVEFETSRNPAGIRVTAEVKVSGQTGVEMEALTAVSVACLTIYDMLKAADKAMTLGGIRLLEKTGGRSGTYRAARRKGSASSHGRRSPSKRPWLASSMASTPTSAEPVAIEAAHRRTLAEPLAALLTQPPFDASAMDGYAVRAADVAQLPATLAVDRRGSRRSSLRRQRRRRAGRAHLHRRAAARRRRCYRHPGGYRRATAARSSCAKAASTRATSAPAASTSAKARRLLAAGRRLGAREVALAAAMGHGALPVRRRPRVAILSTGDELVAPGQRPGPGQIVSSNHLGVAALAEAAGAEARLLGIARDTRESLDAHFAEAQDADIIVTIGGASVGDHDLVAPVLEARGMALSFWKIAMRPGKPLMFGRLGQARVLGLPGNPVSSLVCARLFLVPLIRALLGLRR